MSPVRFLLPALCLFGFSSCGIFNPKPTYKAADKMAVVPADFLYTKYGPLNRWLDTAVRVQIFDVPLNQVLSHPTLRGINYRVIESSPDNPIIFIDKIAMTRRQLLWSLAQDHQLHLTPVVDSPDGPAFIEIRSRVASNEAKARGNR